MRAAAGLLLLVTGCAATLDHQAELLLHPCPAVQAPAIAGALPGALASAPLWGTAALLDGPGGEFAALLLHAFAYPGALLLGGVPLALAGPSWEYGLGGGATRALSRGPARGAATGSSP